MTEKITSGAIEKIECKAARDPLVRATAGLFFVLAGAAWCAYDIFIAAKFEYKPFSEDINAWGEYMLNLAGAVVLPVIAVIVLYKLIRFRSVVFSADSKGVFKNGELLFRWPEVNLIDASRLAAKDIIVLHYSSPTKKLELDGWKLTNFRPMLEKIQENVSSELMKMEK